MNFRNMFSSILGHNSKAGEPAPSERDVDSLIDGLRGALPDTLQWKWDDRFNCVVAAFPADEEASMREAVGAQLDQQWSRAELRGAPRAVQKAAKDFGGLTPGQRLFVSGLAEGNMLLGLWWPWGNGATISIRFTPHGEAGSEAQTDAIRAQLREKFEL